MDEGGDLLDGLLEPLRLRGVFHSRWHARAPWAVDGEREDGAILHYVREGACAVELPGRDPVMLGAGDLAVFPHGTAHRIADRPGRRGVPLAEVLPGRAPGGARTVGLGGAGAATVLLCGGLHYDAAAAAPLYRALPPVLVVRHSEVAAEPLLGGTLERLAEEAAADRPGGRLVALRGFEMVYVLTLRVALAAEGADAPLLVALRHPGVGRALAAVHRRFAEPWTLAALAAHAGMSRSAFAAAFRELVGEPPMRHLAARRLQEAARLVSTTPLPLEAVAARVGYGSATGLHLAFRERFGRTPGSLRRAPGGYPEYPEPRPSAGVGPTRTA
jgi:AraC-like DNA-binding protein